MGYLMIRNGILMGYVICWMRYLMIINGIYNHCDYSGTINHAIKFPCYGYTLVPRWYLKSQLVHGFSPLIWQIHRFWPLDQFSGPIMTHPHVSKLLYGKNDEKAWGFGYSIFRQTLESDLSFWDWMRVLNSIVFAGCTCAILYTYGM